MPRGREMTPSRQAKSSVQKWYVKTEMATQWPAASDVFRALTELCFSRVYLLAR
jgi:hypothetical protein